jgi:hypothetical protein
MRIEARKINSCSVCGLRDIMGCFESVVCELPKAEADRPTMIEFTNVMMKMKSLQAVRNSSVVENSSSIKFGNGDEDIVNDRNYLRRRSCPHYQLTQPS